MTTSFLRLALTFLVVVVSVTVSAARPTPSVPADDARVSARAGAASRFDELPPVLPGVDSFRSHRDLLGVDLDSASYVRVRGVYDETAGELRSALEQRSAAEQQLSLLSAARERELATLGAATARRDSFATVTDEMSSAIGELAVAVFVDADPGAVLTALDDPGAANQQQRNRALTVAVVNSLVAERNAALVNVERAEASRITATNALADVEQRLATVREQLAVSTDTTRTLAPVLAERRDSVETERALADVTGTDMTLVALDAYYRAAESVGESDPGCGIQWWAIAGISRVEGQHGTYGGSMLDASGSAEPPIIGIPLTGENGTAFIGDSDGGLIDGDTVFDRAVGPMQFIPDTWLRFAVDGNGDGEVSPNNLYDAAAAAAAYLCRSGRGLTSDPALQTAYFSYNRSLTYVASVLSYAREYESTLPIGDR